MCIACGFDTMACAIITTPDDSIREDFWQEGWDAFVSGKEWTDNPYPEFNDKRFGEWGQGFDEAETISGYVKEEINESTV